MTASELKSALASGAHKNISTQVNQTKQQAQSVPSAADAQWANMAAAYTGKSQQLEQMKARGADEETIGLFVGAGGKPKSPAEVVQQQQPAAAAGKGNFFQRLFNNPVLNQARSLVDLLGQQGRQNMSAYQRTGQMPSGQSTAQRNAINSLLGLGVGGGGVGSGGGGGGAVGGGGGGSWGGTPAPITADARTAAIPSYLNALPSAPTERTGAEQSALQRLRSIPVSRDTTDQYASPQQAATTAFRRMIAGPLEGGGYQRPEMLNPEYRFPEAIRAPSGLAMTNPMTGDQYLASSTEEQGDVTTGSRFGMEDAAQRLLEDPEAMQQAMRDYAVELAESGQLKGINPEDVINAIGGGVYQPGQSAAEYGDILGGSKQAKAVEKELQSQEDRAKRLGTEEEKAQDEEADSLFAQTYGVDPTKISGVPRNTALRIGGTDQFKSIVQQLSDTINPFSAKEDVQSQIESVVPAGGPDYAATVRILQHILASGGMQQSE